MRLAVFGDIHANLEALQAVRADARSEGCARYACTGDVVGYNANPNECAEVLRGMECPVVRGNHDQDASGTHPLLGLSPKAHHSLMWTREKLSRENREWLASLPYVLHPDDFTLVHATLDQPESWGYVLDSKHAANSFKHQESALCFHGHTHLPVVYACSDNELATYRERVALRSSIRYLCNVGSVGKPRERDRRATYAIYDDSAETVTIRRVEYDSEAALQKSKDAGLIA